VRRVLRTAGTITLVISLFMALFGAYGIDYTASAKLFFIYWTIFFVMLMSAVGIAVVDILMTIFKFRKEHADLRREFGSRTRKTDAHDI
jgi:amino acid transporter